jgi:glutathione S-transferase
LETVKLHRCSFGWRKGAGHSCWRVQQALDEQGIPYEIVKAPAIRGRRARVIELTGQQLLPVIELADGTAYREDSAEMVARIRAGQLFDPR